MEKYDKGYWQKRYLDGKTGWDIGYIATPIKEYIDQLNDQSIRILVPGAGKGYEVEYLFESGFKKTFLLDFASHTVTSFLRRVPKFPENQIINEDFFEYNGKYDLIVELAFFSSLKPNQREDYVSKMFELLKPDGKLVGLLFNHEFDNPFPPFGGTIDEYQKLFETKFLINKMEVAYNSIKPRNDRELFFILQKPLSSEFKE